MWNATKPLTAIQKKHIQGYGYSNKLLYLPDTDVYHIGLALLGRYPQSDVFNSVRTVTPQFFVQLSRDPDFAIIPSEIRPKVLKTLYVLYVITSPFSLDLGKLDFYTACKFYQCQL